MNFRFYTQNDEEKYIISSLSNLRSGRFLDIGAHDGVTFSSTRKLWELGWSGVYVEPSPDVLPLLKNNSGSNCEILPVAIGTTNGKMEFFSGGTDMIGTLSTEHVKLWSSHVNFTRKLVDVITISELEKRVGTKFDFINIDVEGTNLEVFNQFDWNIWKPKCVCVEYESHKDYMTNVMVNAGYELVYVSSENLVFNKQPRIAFVNFANGSYVQPQKDLINSIKKHTNYDILHFNEYEELGCKPHHVSPYGFKVYAIERAKNLGYDIVIWCDSSMRLIKPIKEWIAQIEDVGVYLPKDGWKCGQWANDRTLEYFGKSRDDAMNMSNVYACVMAFDFRKKITNDFFKEFKKCEDLLLFKGEGTNNKCTESRDERCLGHRYDQTCAELIADKLYIELQPAVFSYNTTMPNRFFSAWDHP